ncbi:MAG: hypothetical protein LBR34_03455 [Prevotella sp.]|jgi:hypothetical protein|nr:hypothetical protein [Prevotella sp.]
MRKFFYILFILALVACESEEALPPQLPQRTVIAYLCGDNNLSSEIDVKISAMQRGMAQVDERNSLIVYADYNNAMPKLLKVTASEIKTLEEYTECNSASASNFGRILQKVMSDFPAQSYGLICFSHASGWLPPKALNNPTGFAGEETRSVRTIFEDESAEMELEDFAAAIPLTPAGDKFDFILFETCYMAGVETACALKNKTRYMLASSAEMLSNGFVEIYPSQLGGLFEPDAKLEDFAKAYFDYWNNRVGAARSATISLLDLSGMDSLAAVVRSMPVNTGSIAISSIQHFNRNAYHLFFDLSDYVSAIATPEQKTAYEEVLSQIVRYQAATPQFMQGQAYSFTIRRHSGLTVYIRQDGFPALNSAYGKLQWSRAVGIEE